MLLKTVIPLRYQRIKFKQYCMHCYVVVSNHIMYDCEFHFVFDLMCVAMVLSNHIVCDHLFLI